MGFVFFPVFSQYLAKAEKKWYRRGIVILISVFLYGKSKTTAYEAEA
jgi:hypothetical protein